MNNNNNNNKKVNACHCFDILSSKRNSDQRADPV